MTRHGPGDRETGGAVGMGVIWGRTRSGVSTQERIFESGQAPPNFGICDRRAEAIGDVAHPVHSRAKTLPARVRPRAKKEEERRPAGRWCVVRRWAAYRSGGAPKGRKREPRLCAGGR